MVIGKDSLRLHHVGLAVKTIDAVAATYASRYGYEYATAIIHDPHQTAYVQFLRLPGDQTFLEFVAPDGPESTLTTAIARRGSQLNHLCYSVGHLEQAMARLEDDGMRMISPPAPAVAFGGRRICWLIGDDLLPIELVERSSDADLCLPGTLF